MSKIDEPGIDVPEGVALAFLEAAHAQFVEGKDAEAGLEDGKTRPLSQEELDARAAIADLQASMDKGARDPEGIVVEADPSLESGQAALDLGTEPEAGTEKKPAKKKKKKKLAVRDGATKLSYGPKKRLELARLIGRIFTQHQVIDPTNLEEADHEFESSLGKCIIAKQPGKSGRMEYNVWLDIRDEVLPEGGDIASVDWTWTSENQIKFRWTATEGVGQSFLGPKNSDIDKMSKVRSDSGSGEGFALTEHQLDEVLGPIHTSNVVGESVNKQTVLLAQSINLQKLLEEALS